VGLSLVFVVVVAVVSVVVVVAVVAAVVVVVAVAAAVVFSVVVGVDTVAVAVADAFIASEHAKSGGSLPTLLDFGIFLSLGTGGERTVEEERDGEGG